MDSCSGTSVLTLGPHYFFQGTGGYLADLGELLRCLSPLAALMSVTGTETSAAKD